jgi:hypothetical protein
MCSARTRGDTSGPDRAPAIMDLETMQGSALLRLAAGADAAPLWWTSFAGLPTVAHSSRRGPPSRLGAGADAAAMVDILCRACQP